MKKTILALLLALTCVIINATATRFVNIETTGPFVVSNTAGCIEIFAELDDSLACNVPGQSDQRIALSYPPFFNNPTWLSGVTVYHMGNGFYRIILNYSDNNTGILRSGWFRIDLQYYNQYEGMWMSYSSASTHILDQISQFCSTVTNPYQAAITNAPNNSTVTIPAGVHVGHLVINNKHNLTIRGAGITGNDVTTIQCAGNASTITITGCTNLTIQDMMITNGIFEKGSGINCSHSTVTIENCLIKDNNASQLYSGGLIPDVTKGGAIYVTGYDATCTVRSSIIYDNDAELGKTAYVWGGNIVFDACNLLESTTGSNYDGHYWEAFTFLNSIISSANLNMGTYNYCCSYDQTVTLPGSNNIRTTDPMFTDSSTDDYSLRKGSPCIGMGYNPDYDDPDTPGYDQNLITVFDETQEIGAVNFEWDRYTTYTFTDDPDANWMCFPVVDDYSTVEIDGVAYTKDIMRAFFLQYEPPASEMDNVSYLFYNSNWVGMHWHTPSSPRYDPIERNMGYKALFDENSIMPLTGTIHGYHIPYTAPVPVPVSNTEWWVGYFIPETQLPHVAFGSFLDELYFLKGKNWAATRLKPTRNSPWVWAIGPSGPSTISYGDMVIVKKLADSQQNQFTWNRLTSVPACQKVEPDYFTFTKEPDYTPIFVEVDSLSTFKELAVIMDGDCYGAAVVDGSTVMIPAYIDSVPNGAEIQIVGWDGAKSKSAPLDLRVYNSNADVFYLSSSITKEGYDFYYVKLGEGEDNTNVPTPLNLEVSNYPNPFNPSTTIRYTVPDDGDVKINVYNTRGQLVTTLVNERKDRGAYSLIWNGKDKNGNQVSSGVYYTKVTTGGKSVTAKMLLLK